MNSDFENKLKADYATSNSVGCNSFKDEAEQASGDLEQAEHLLAIVLDSMIFKDSQKVGNTDERKYINVIQLAMDRLQNVKVFVGTKLS